MLSSQSPTGFGSCGWKEIGEAHNLAMVTGDLARETRNREALANQVSSLNQDIDSSKQELDGLRDELKVSENQTHSSRKMASVGQLVASVTHDIANPTTHILVSQSALASKIEELLGDELESLSEDKFRKELNVLLRYSEFIRSGASTIADIHRSFAYYSRADPKMRSSVDIEKVLKDAMTILTTRVQPHILTTDFLSVPELRVGHLNFVRWWRTWCRMRRMRSLWHWNRVGDAGEEARSGQISLRISADRGGCGRNRH